MTQVDQFESVFRSAAKTPFEYEAIEVDSVLVVSDRGAEEAKSFGERVRSFLSVLDRGENVRWRTVHGGEYDSVPELLELVEAERPGLVCTYRHLHSESWRWPYTLGEYVDVLTQATTTPVLVLPHPERGPERGTTDTDTVMAMTDHLLGDHRLVNWAARVTDEKGRLILASVEDEGAFDRLIDVVSRIPSIETDHAREEIAARLLREAEEYATSSATVLAAAGLPFAVESLVRMGHHLSEFLRLIEEHDVDLLVMNTKDDDQLAMHGLAYPLAIEVRSIPLLLL